MEKIKKHTGQPGFDKNIYLRTTTLKFCVSKSENLKLRQIAFESEYNTLSQFLREIALTPIGELRPNEIKKLHGDAIYEIGRIGNSLNQIAKKCNQGNQVDTEVLEALEKIKSSVDQIFETMKR